MSWVAPLSVLQIPKEQLPVTQLESKSQDSPTFLEAPLSVLQIPKEQLFVTQFESKVQDSPTFLVAPDAKHKFEFMKNTSARIEKNSFIMSPVVNNKGDRATNVPREISQSDTKKIT